MSKYQISKEFHFSAAHVLDGLNHGHQCSRLHGHNYIVVVVLESDTLDGKSFVVDYGDLSPIKDFVDNKLDHRFMAKSLEQAQRYSLPNDEFCILGYQTSAENLARYIYGMFIERFPALTEVRVSETPKTWAIYRNS